MPAIGIADITNVGKLGKGRRRREAVEAMMRQALIVLAVALTGAQASLAAQVSATANDAAAPTLAEVRLAAGQLPPPPRPKPERKPDIEHQGVRLKAVLNGEGPILDRGVEWRVVPLAGGPAITSTLPAPAIELTPGAYRAHVASGLVEAETEFRILPDQIEELTLDLAAGRLHVSAKPGTEYMPLKNARFLVRRVAGMDTPDGPAEPASGAPLATAAGGEADLLLPAGRFRVEARLGLVRANEVVEIAPGATKELSFDLDVGFIGAEARAADGTEPLQTATFSLFPLNPVEPGAAELATRMGRHAVFAVSPGQYRLVGRFGHAEAEQIVTATPNRLTPVSLTLKAARLTLEVIGPDPGQGEGLPARVTITPLAAAGKSDGSLAPIAAVVAPRPSLRLPAGRYEVAAERDGVSERATVDLAAGDQVRRRLVLGGGTVSLRIDMPDGLEIGDPTIELMAWPLGEEGPPIRLGSSVEAPFRLPAGPYRIEAIIQPGLVRAEREILVAPGTGQTADLKFDLGRAELELLEKDGGPPVAVAAWRLESAAAPAPIRLGGGQIDVALSPGTYALSAETGDAVASGELVVVSGETARLSLVAE